MTDDEHTLIYRAVDEELRPEDVRRLRRLVHRSPEARAELEALRTMRTLVAQHGGAPFAPGFSERVMQRLASPSGRRDRSAIHHGTRQRQPSMPWRRIGGALAVVVVFIGIGVLLGQWPQTVHVPHGETEVVTLPDGSTAELSAGSMLRYTPFWASSTRHVTLDGEAFFEVADNDRPFVVETFNARVVVKGTRFNVRAWSDDPAPETAVTLTAGSVELVPGASTASPLTLVPGETSVVRGDTGRVSLPTTRPLDRVLSWRSGGIAFANQPLGGALRTLERRFDLHIELADAALANRPLTYLNPQPESAATVLSDICHVLDLRYQRTAHGYVILRK